MWFREDDGILLMDGLDNHQTLITPRFYHIIFMTFLILKGRFLSD